MAIVASLFGDLAQGQNLQALIDNQIQLLYGQSIWRKHLDWGLPQIELTFATAIGRSRIEAAASIVDPDSPAPKRSRNKLEKLEGKIPTMKEAFDLNQDDYRKLRSLENLPISDQAKLQSLIKHLWDDVQLAATSTDRRLDIMFLQGVSSFEIDVNVINNPDGVDFGKIDLLAGSDQKRTVAKVWTDPTADPIKDIEDVVSYAGAKGRRFAEIWMDQATWTRFKNHPEVYKKLAAFYNPGSGRNVTATRSAINEYMVENELPQIVVQNHRIAVEKDGKPDVINPFKVENVVFVPGGKLGIVHNAIAIETMEPVEGINYATYDRTLVSKWRDNNPWKEYTQCELNAFPALEQIDAIYLLQTDIPTV